jgi:predicted transcriptional regulator
MVRKGVLPPISRLDVQHWQIEHIKTSLRQADAGEFVPPAEVKQQWTRPQASSRREEIA